ncbi:glycosyl hydrolase family 76-domain-containing protein [Thelonectria olida]|uniref:Glycosyl hydrolase family 76-domain-containing protein n=1 Tax=Thelonectria olida TaxID=1576542 RepID=A0A9P8WGV5_9HYPO|nr:glycosyl hydrolase family 76-domain-containing protein [Thelonectria olida]
MARLSTVVGFIGFLASHIALSVSVPTRENTQEYCPIIYNTATSNNCKPLPETFLFFSSRQSQPHTDAQVLDYAVQALVVLQDQYFVSDYGTWPTTIDWTAAVTGTVITGLLNTLSKTLVSARPGGSNDWKAKENLISSYYAHLVSFYYGQDVLSLRGQAYDDILWVALEWVEAIKFVRTHADLHYPRGESIEIGPETGLNEIMKSVPWHGEHWYSAFAHRSRIFWNLGSRGWETKLCDGGMVWNPRLNPYKNAITNELWIAASVSMYQYFPGDNFTSPWLANTVFPKQDPAHLQGALKGYEWLMGVNMTNKQGLFVDGYHIDRRRPGNTKCDLRDEMVYTYNQGVLLTGQRGLWTVSGRASYLKQGHDLIQSVIEATGWSLEDNKPIDNINSVPSGRLPPWRGLGRGGIIEEQCDASGTCSQDGQTFKGVFFHHLATFCSPLDPIRVEDGMKVDERGYQRVKTAHATACGEYLGWIKHNVLAALGTRDAEGRFGMWWGAGVFDAVVTLDNDGIDHNAANTTDYRNQGTPEDDTWGGNHPWIPGTGGWTAFEAASGQQQVVRGLKEAQEIDDEYIKQGISEHKAGEPKQSQQDPNTRGRGRTVETQVGGLALLRAYWELSQSY